jgi:phage-related protein
MCYNDKQRGDVLFEIDFYRDANGRSDVLDYIKELRKKSDSSKNDRINYQKILSYINLLKRMGLSVGEPVLKSLGEGLYELRPERNRILFFYWDNNKYVMLSHFIKKTQKTPKREIDKAKRRRKDYIENGGNK